MKKIILIFLLFQIYISCQNKDEIFRNNYDLEYITENLKPESYKSELLKDSIILETDSINEFTSISNHIQHSTKGINFKWKEYIFKSKYYNQYVGKFSRLDLDKINFVYHNNYLVGVIGTTRSAYGQDITETINYLTKKYGQPVDLVKIQGRNSIVQQELKLYWQNNKKLIGLALVSNASNPDDIGTISIVNYQIYVFNQNSIKKLNGEGIELKDFFSTTENEDHYYFKNIFADIILKDIENKKKK